MNTIPTIFSALIASYNNREFLSECIESILSQTYQAIEIIIVDDYSNDGSTLVYNKYKHDSRIKVYFNEKNHGVGYTKDKCIRLATGDICGFIDPDDKLDHSAIEIMVRAHEQNPSYSLIYSTHYICDNLLNIKEVAQYVGQIPEGQKSWCAHRPTISHFATFKRRNYLSTTGISPYLLKAADKDLYYKLEDTGPVLFINKPLYYYRHHEKSISLHAGSKIAYKYSLVGKFNVVLRSNNKKETLQKIPNNLNSLIEAVIFISVIELKRKNYKVGFLLSFRGFLFSPIVFLQIFFNKILQILNIVPYK